MSLMTETDTTTSEDFDVSMEVEPLAVGTMSKNGIATRLKDIRVRRRVGQREVGFQLGISRSEVSRIELGRRRLPLHYLSPWCAALGVRTEVIFWNEDVTEGGLECLSGELDQECMTILRQVAAGLAHMPAPARDALAHQVRVWRENSPDGPDDPRTDYGV